jgi:hypothetical protein
MNKENEISKRIKDYFQKTPSNSQTKALELLEKFIESNEKCFILKGYAGTGKTTLLKALIDYLKAIQRPCFICAPTGRAAKVISDKAEHKAYTIHKTIYSYDNLKPYISEDEEEGKKTFKYYFGLRKLTDDTQNAVYIVDESSMISDVYSEGEFFRFGSGKLLADLIQYTDLKSNKNTKVILIGDNAQLPPVKCNFSPALSEKYLNDTFEMKSIFSIELTDVFRQGSESGILVNATNLRDCINKKDFNTFQLNQNFTDLSQIKSEHILDKYIQVTDNTIDNQLDNAIVITYSNKLAWQYNHIIRSYFFKNRPFIKIKQEISPNDFIIDETPEISPNDTLIISRNNYRIIYDLDDNNQQIEKPIELLNGDFVKVISIDPIQQNDIRQVPVYIDNKKTYVELIFRTISINVIDTEKKSHIISCKILDNFLNSKQPQLTSAQFKALFIDFSSRFWKDNPSIVERLKEENAKRKQNGQKAKPIEETEEFKNALKKDPYFNALLVKYGYAVTCHKAQGGEWNYAFVDFEGFSGHRNSNFFRWAYTAITRAKKYLFTINAPILKSTSTLQWIDFENITDIVSFPTISLKNKSNDFICKFEFPTEKQFLKDFCISLIQKISSENIEISEITHNLKGWNERYTFKKENQQAIIDYYYTGKNTFSKHNIISSNPVEFANQIIELQNLEIETEETFEEFETRLNFPKDKLFLKDFFYIFHEKLSEQEIIIHSIEHGLWFEKYFLKKSKERLVLNLSYDGKNRITKAQSEKTNSKELYYCVKNIIIQGL